MMIINNECCGCAAPGYPCLGNRCPNRQVIRYYCDRCGREVAEEIELYAWDGSELCEECVFEIEEREEKVS